MMPWPKASGQPLDADRLRELLDYDAGTGVFTRRVSVAPRAMAGQVAGDIDGKGYIRLRIDGRRYLGHRVAWLYVHGEWPADEVDHINGVRTDNRIVNLRNATRAQNAWNASGWRESASASKGVSKACGKGRWRARIRTNGREQQIGAYDTEHEACLAYQDAASAAFGEFARRD